MLAVDTNVIIRYLTADHPEQYAKATAVIEGNRIFVSKTTLLETEWVLRSLYGYQRESTADRLIAFAALPKVTVEDRVASLTALDWFRRGLDFADAMHLASAAGCEALVSFDKGFAKLANPLSELKVRSP